MITVCLPYDYRWVSLGFWGRFRQRPRVATGPLCLRLTALVRPLFKGIALSPDLLARCRPAPLRTQAERAAAAQVHEDLAAKIGQRLALYGSDQRHRQVLSVK